MQEELLLKNIPSTLDIFYDVGASEIFSPVIMALEAESIQISNPQIRIKPPNPISQDKEEVSFAATLLRGGHSLLIRSSCSGAGNSLNYGFAMSTIGKVAMELPLPLDAIKGSLTAIGMKLDFNVNPELRKTFEPVGEGRLSANLFSGKEDEKSLMFGARNPNKGGGFVMYQRIYLQNPSANYLKCYAVELFNGKQKGSQETPLLSPEAVWQDDEQHYCLTDAGDSDAPTYPFVPMHLGEISHLDVDIRFTENPHEDLIQQLAYILPPFNDSGLWYFQTRAPSGRLTFAHRFDSENGAHIFAKAYRIAKGDLDPEVFVATAKDLFVTMD